MQPQRLLLTGAAVGALAAGFGAAATIAGSGPEKAVRHAAHRFLRALASERGHRISMVAPPRPISSSRASGASWERTKFAASAYEERVRG
jgi:hypothetical protein